MIVHVIDEEKRFFECENKIGLRHQSCKLFSDNVHGDCLKMRRKRKKLNHLKAFLTLKRHERLFAPLTRILHHQTTQDPSAVSFLSLHEFERRFIDGARGEMTAPLQTSSNHRLKASSMRRKEKKVAKFIRKLNQEEAEKRNLTLGISSCEMAASDANCETKEFVFHLRDGS